jgi:hypothetical protein
MVRRMIYLHSWDHIGEGYELMRQLVVGYISIIRKDEVLAENTRRSADVDVRDSGVIFLSEAPIVFRMPRLPAPPVFSAPTPRDFQVREFSSAAVDRLQDAINHAREGGPNDRKF